MNPSEDNNKPEPEILFLCNNGLWYSEQWRRSIHRSIYNLPYLFESKEMIWINTSCSFSLEEQEKIKLKGMKFLFEQLWDIIFSYIPNLPECPFVSFPIPSSFSGRDCYFTTTSYFVPLKPLSELVILKLNCDNVIKHQVVQPGHAIFFGMWIPENTKIATLSFYCSIPFCVQRFEIGLEAWCESFTDRGRITRTESIHFELWIKTKKWEGEWNL